MPPEQQAGGVSRPLEVVSSADDEIEIDHRTTDSPLMLELETLLNPLENVPFISILDDGSPETKLHLNDSDDGTTDHLFVPADYDSPDRLGRIWSARLNLLTSMVGGGSLSLPLAFTLAGNALFAPLLVLFCSITSTFTLRALMDASTRCSQVTGPAVHSSYELIASVAFGRRAKYVTMSLVILVCFFGALAYCVLLRDLTVPLAHAMHPPSDPNHSIAEHGPTPTENALMFLVVVLVTPLCCLKTLTALRQVGALSMLSIGILAICIIYRSVQCNSGGGDDEVPSTSRRYVLPPVEPNWRHYLTYLPSSLPNLADAFPVIQSCFFCHFNAVPVHNELRCPTPARTSYLTVSTIGTSAVFYLIVGFFGSMYGNCTPDGIVDGNVLLDFSDGDPVLGVGRVCLGVTIALAFPMQIIPARDTCIRLLGVWLEGCGDGGERADGLEEPLLLKKGTEDELEVDEAVVAAAVAAAPPPPPLSIEEEDDDDDDLPIEESSGTKSSSRCLNRERLLCTSIGTALFWTSAVIASLVKSVDVVWDLLGSSLVIMIGFIIPCGAYLRLCRGGSTGGTRLRRGFAWAVLVLYVPLMVVCTANAIVNVVG